MVQRRWVIGGLMAGILVVSAVPGGGGEPALVSSAEEVSPALVGTPVPDGPVKMQDGVATTLSELRAGQPAVLVFYRGHW